MRSRYRHDSSLHAIETARSRIFDRPERTADSTEGATPHSTQRDACAQLPLKSGSAENGSFGFKVGGCVSLPLVLDLFLLISLPLDRAVDGVADDGDRDESKGQHAFVIVSDHPSAIYQPCVQVGAAS